ncbi:plasmid replication protein RepC [Pseudogemmobacter bohemicus]|uniref:plasmid replication protein RepC n=1 Tax=Pseudogemmobacter bohemicus TaxID=2250708 RepID=UPI000DD3BD56|nr:plasmid replication protein RepC [Pseudogemmobacter bohemicus]
MKALSRSLSRAVGNGYNDVVPRDANETSSLWQVFRNLVAARTTLDVSPQALGTLRALISFVKPSRGLVVFASNRTVSERADGASERSIRRHIAELISAGLLSRKASTNGKRYKVANPDGHDDVYGLDVSPLLYRAAEFESLAAEAAEETLRIKLQRKRLSSLIYAARELLPTGRLAEVTRALRRRHNSAFYSALYRQVAAEAAEAEQQRFATRTTDEQLQNSAILASNDGQNDRHKIKSNKEEFDSDSPQRNEVTNSEATEPSGILRTIADRYPDALAWAEAPVTSWHGLEKLAWNLANWCGIGDKLRQKAHAAVSSEVFICAALHIAQASHRIRNPAAYFAAVTLGKRRDTFHPLTVAAT